MKAVIYARYSSHAQREESIEGQLRVCYDYAARQGFDVIDEYIDRAISGTTDERPSFQRMISDSARGVFDIVLVYALTLLECSAEKTCDGSVTVHLIYWAYHGSERGENYERNEKHPA